MSLPMSWVDRIFEKLTLLYGREFVGRWSGAELEQVKADWAHELAGFQAHPWAIAYALQHAPADRPPTVLQFRALARQAPPPPTPRLEAPPPNRERAAEALRLAAAGLRKAPDAGGLAWAHRILERERAGDPVHHATLRMAREAIQRQQRGVKSNEG